MFINPFILINKNIIINIVALWKIALGSTLNLISILKPANLNIIIWNNFDNKIPIHVPSKQEVIPISITSTK